MGNKFFLGRHSKNGDRIIITIITLFLILLLRHKRKVCWLPIKQSEKLARRVLYSYTLAVVLASFHLNKMRLVAPNCNPAENVEHSSNQIECVSEIQLCHK